MGSGTFSFRISGSLIKEDLRRFWTLPLVFTIAYFLSGVFVVMLQYNAAASADGSTANNAAYFIEALLSGKYPVYFLLTSIMPVIAAALVFRYLFSSGEVLICHSQPFTRTTMINSHAMSAAILCVIPLAVTGLLLLLLVHPVYYSESYYQTPSQMDNLYTLSKVLRWLLAQMICVLFVLSISVLSAMITGTGVHHIMASIGFNIIAPVTAMIFVIYAEIYLFGFSGDISQEMSLALSMSPVTYQLIDHGSSTAADSFIYFLAAFLIYLLSVFLYNIRKLERTGFGVVFAAVEWAIAFIFGMLGMTAVGMTFKELLHTPGIITAAGYIAGAFIAIVICMMILRKKLKVMDMHTMRVACTFMVCMAVFLGIMNAGGFGFEKRIPDDPGSVTVNISDLPDALSYNSTFVNAYDAAAGKLDADALNDHGISFNREEGIKAAMDLHRLIIDNKGLCLPDSSSVFYTSSTLPDTSLSYEDMVDVRIDYHSGADAKNSPVTETRSYSVPLYLIYGSSEFKEMFDRPSYRKMFTNTIEELSTEDVTHTTVFNSENVGSADFENGFDIPDDTDISGLVAALKDDAENMTYSEYISMTNRDPLGMVSFYQNTDKTSRDRQSSKAKSSVSQAAGGSVSGRELAADSEKIDLVVQPYCRETIKWLRDNAGLDLMQTYGGNFDAALIYATDGKPVEGYAMSEEGMSDAATIDSLEKYAAEGGAELVTDETALRSDFTASVSHSVLGKISDITTEKDKVYYVEFYSSNDDGSLLNDYSAYIRASDLKK